MGYSVMAKLMYHNLEERWFFNDGTIQYLEDSLNKRITNLGFYENTTKQTTTGTANTSDEEDCNEYLDDGSSIDKFRN